ncbi:alpha/beta hydrolase fold domain-containing protein [Hirsutella rhossiliensis]|uniref:Alpha/beta hydrolase fold domain-containing protein n=1 Tax=Hirsutella rhossiliensis TaxID=111463 RepID=A0A9P8N5M9_9HYPO|nr:alpha/beta hydrolase fold domain-containing protein [Hirsutella rhossiliensis]KAH0967224.1 alpha/beta hydrolase fold domain-containing protein [Hirsutella rhossiliensis]
MALLSAASASAQAKGVVDGGPFPDDLNGSNFTYPWPVKLFRFTSQLQPLEMAFMDVGPSCEPNGKTALLLHGKNFCGATWQTTIRTLAAKGYRVLAPDQIGFCKSSKPSGYQFSLSQLAWNTRGLLDTLGIANVTVVGHSMGGMMAARFGLQYPETVDRLVLVAPVGLEDYVQKGVPYITIDDSLASEAASTYQSIRRYEQDVYYVGRWQSVYDTWVKMLVNIYHGSMRDAYLRNQAQIIDMVLTSPVSHLFGDIKPRTLLIVGDKDKTAIGSQWAPPDVARTLGHFDVLGPQVARQIPRCALRRFADMGHAPQVSDPERFHEVLLAWVTAE